MSAQHVFGTPQEKLHNKGRFETQNMELNAYRRTNKALLNDIQS